MTTSKQTPTLEGVPREGELLTDSRTTPPDDRSVLGRTALILDAFDGGTPVLQLTELSVRTGLPKSTVHRLANQLLDIGWLERSPARDGYCIGMRLFEIGGLAESRRRLRATAVPVLHDLCATTRLSAHLGVLRGPQVVYLERFVAPGIDIPTRQGGRMPAYCTALGKVMLAFEGEELLEQVIAAGFRRFTPSTLADEDSLRRDLEKIRSHGVAYDNGEAVGGVYCVAAPIRGSGRAIGAISVVSPNADFNAASLSSLVRDAANRVWAEMFGSRGGAVMHRAAGSG